MLKSPVSFGYYFPFFPYLAMIVHWRGILHLETVTAISQRTRFIARPQEGRREIGCVRV